MAGEAGSRGRAAPILTVPPGLSGRRLSRAHLSALGPLATPSSLVGLDSCLSHLSDPRDRHCPPRVLPSQSSQLTHTLRPTPSAFLGWCPQHGAAEGADRMLPHPVGTPALCSLLGVPRNDLGLCQGEGAAPAASQAAGLGCWGAVTCSGKLFLAAACSLLLISCPCDPGNALLPRAATPRLQSLFLVPQEPGCLCCLTLEVGAAQGCLAAAAGRPALSSSAAAHD